MLSVSTLMHPMVWLQGGCGDRGGGGWGGERGVVAQSGDWGGLRLGLQQPMVWGWTEFEHLSLQYDCPGRPQCYLVQGTLFIVCSSLFAVQLFSTCPVHSSFTFRYDIEIMHLSVRWASSDRELTQYNTKGRDFEREISYLYGSHGWFCFKSESGLLFSDVAQLACSWELLVL